LAIIKRAQIIIFYEISKIGYLNSLNKRYSRCIIPHDCRRSLNYS